MKKSLPMAEFPPTKGYVKTDGGVLAHITGNEHRINSNAVTDTLKNIWSEQTLVALERTDNTWDVFSLNRAEDLSKGRPVKIRDDFSLVQSGVSKNIAVETIQAHDARSKNAAPAPVATPS